MFKFEAMSRLVGKCVQAAQAATASGRVLGVGLVAGGLVTGPLANAQTCNPIEITKLTAFDGETEDQFGYAVRIDGDTAVVGDKYDDNNGNSDTGSVYVYRRVGGDWVLETKLVAPDAAAGDFFGQSVDISGDTIVVGSYLDTVEGVRTGSVYVYTREGSTWSLEAKLLAFDREAFDRYGRSIAIDGDTVVVGASTTSTNGPNSGTAYVYKRSAGIWLLEVVLEAFDAQTNDLFGFTTDIDADTIVVGAKHDNYNGFTDIGSAYVYKRDGGTWSLETKLLSGNGNDIDDFSNAVSVNGDRILVAAENADFEGIVHVFVRDAGVWTLEAQLLAFDGGNGAGYGSSVDIEGDLAIVGARFDDEIGVRAGSVYIYRQEAGVWFHEGKFIVSDGQLSDRFGSSVAMSGGIVISSALLDDVNGIVNAGSAYIFSLGCETPCPADLTGDGLLDFFDVQAFLALLAAEDPASDFNNDGIIDFFDVAAYLAAFSAGCP
jgi:FG-GAP repeat protein